jgi:hypothetical protein
MVAEHYHVYMLPDSQHRPLERPHLRPLTINSLRSKSFRETLDFSAPQALLTLSIFELLDLKPICIPPG